MGRPLVGYDKPTKSPHFQELGDEYEVELPSGKVWFKKSVFGRAEIRGIVYPYHKDYKVYIEQRGQPRH